ncbi:hypothetical protein HZA44_00900 [Candidatus Peregrinibacteria bacterium]|nr:hypothetical protein [Candidatus Peregrinibacteria bacterium]
MAPKVSLIHTRLEDLPENHQRLIREANEDAEKKAAIEKERNRIGATIEAQDSPVFDEAKVRADFAKRLESAIQKLKMPKKPLMLSICAFGLDEDTTWIEIKILVSQMVLWNRSRLVSQRLHKKVESKLSKDPIDELAKMERASEKPALGESYAEVAKALGYQEEDYPAIMQIVDKQLKNEKKIRK